MCVSVLKGCKLFSIYHSLWVNYKMHIPISSPDWRCFFFYQNQRGGLKRVEWIKMETSNSNLNLVFTCVVNNYDALKTSQKSHGSEACFCGYYCNWTTWCLFMTPWMIESFCAACYSTIMYKSATSPTLYNCSYIIHYPFREGESLS